MAVGLGRAVASCLRAYAVHRDLDDARLVSIADHRLVGSDLVEHGLRRGDGVGGTRQDKTGVARANHLRGATRHLARSARPAPLPPQRPPRRTVRRSLRGGSKWIPAPSPRGHRRRVALIEPHRHWSTSSRRMASLMSRWSPTTASPRGCRPACPIPSTTFSAGTAPSIDEGGAHLPDAE